MQRQYSADEIEFPFNHRAGLGEFEDHQARRAGWSAAARAQFGDSPSA